MWYYQLIINSQHKYMLNLFSLAHRICGLCVLVIFVCPTTFHALPIGFHRLTGQPNMAPKTKQRNKNKYTEQNLSKRLRNYEFFVLDLSKYFLRCRQRNTAAQYRFRYICTDKALTWAKCLWLWKQAKRFSIEPNRNELDFWNTTGIFYWDSSFEFHNPPPLANCP